MKTVIFFTAFLITMVSNGNDGVNYDHKAIAKTLEKEGITAQLKEIVLPKDVAEANHLEGKFFEVPQKGDCPIKTIYIGRVNSCRAGGCSLPINDPNMGSSEYFDYMVCFDKNAAVVMVKVFNYQATHGHEVTAKGWLKQFIGYTGRNSLEVGKDIDSISGATISVNGITNDIMDKTRILKLMATAQ